MGAPIVLLGAGSSIDAGLSDAIGLTRKVYRVLSGSYDKSAVTIFGYVINKVIARKIRAGGSPFDDVNIEEAYDAIERLVNRDGDIMGEFVNSWDPILDNLRPKFDGRKFVKQLMDAIAKGSARASRQSLTGGISFGIDRFAAEDAAKEIQKAFGPIDLNKPQQYLEPLTDALISCLSHDPDSIKYVEKLVNYCLGIPKSAIISLNYDLVVENAFDNINEEFDYGLNYWNEQKLVRLRGSKIPFIKLHGSMNWIGEGEEISVSSERPAYYKKRNIIFGGNNGKLTPHGPFLQLRHEFEQRLMATNRLLIIGYSFGDAHLNAIL
jgi:SIR2-like domain